MSKNTPKAPLSDLSKARVLKKGAALPVLVLSAYAKGLLAMATEKSVEFAENPNPNFENKNAGRDAFFAAALRKHGMDVKKATAYIAETMTKRGVQNVALLTAIDAFHYNVLKQAIFPAYIDQMKLIAIRAGKLPDEFYDNLNARESFEDTQNDPDAARRSAMPIDERCETETVEEKPCGTDVDFAHLYSGYEVQIAVDGGKDGNNYGHAFETKDIALGLDDVRIYLETIRASYGKLTDRMSFFVEQVGTEWIRHNGSVHTVLLDFGLKQNEKQAKQRIANDNFYAVEAAKLKAAA